MTSSYSPQTSPGPAAARGPVAGGRVGLSEYTAQRLAELRARRAADAEAEAGSSSVLPVTKAPPPATTTTPSPRVTASSTVSPPSQPPPPPPSSAVAADSVSRFAAESAPRPSSDRRLGPPPSPPSSTTAEQPASDAGSRTPNGSRRPAAAAVQVPPPSRPIVYADVARVPPSEANSSPVARQYQTDNHGASYSPAAVMSSPLASNGSATSGHVVAGRSLAGSSSAAGSAPSGSACAYQQHHQLMTSSGYGSGSSSSNSPSTSRRPMTGNSRPGADDDDDCLGFASLPEQVHRKAVKRGFDFTVMVVGESGLGKSTLLSCLFLNSDLYKDRSVPMADERISKTVGIEKKYMEIEEKGVKLRLTIVDTPGFNDAVNANECWKSIRDYVDSQYDQYYKDETGLNRKNIKDHRVHCCLYFISPYGHGLKQIDIELMRCLQDRVNIVPIIAKSDTLTVSEIRRLKTRILEEIQKHKIRIYEFPECDEDEDEDFKQQDHELKAAVPFAVMASSTVVEVNGRKVRGRLYPWGIVEVDNPHHSDFSKLRQFIISTHMQDLKDVTRDVHYENFRAHHIQEQLVVAQKERNKLKRDSGVNFDAQSETERLLLQKENEIQQMKEMMKMMHAQLAVTKQNGGRAVNGIST